MSDNNHHLTKDTLFDEQLICFQHAKGYRFSIDSVLLAHFTSVRKGDAILDMGTGSGIINLILYFRNKTLVKEISGIEVQQSLADLAKKNYETNNLTNLGVIYQADIRDISSLLAPESFEVVTSNPPFYQVGSGRLCQSKEATIARHLINGGLEEFLKGCFYVLKNKGAAFFVYPAERMTEFTTLASQHRLEVKRLRPVYSYPGSVQAKLILFECIKNGKPGVLFQEPLYVYKRKNGDYTEEVDALYAVTSSSPGL